MPIMIDDKDWEILGELRRDASQSVLKIARKLRLPRSTVQHLQGRAWRPNTSEASDSRRPRMKRSSMKAGTERHRCHTRFGLPCSARAVKRFVPFGDPHPHAGPERQQCGEDHSASR